MTIKGAGTAKIIAIKAGDADYNPIANSYILTVNVIKFEFEKPTVETQYRAGLTIQADLIIEHIERGQVRFESDTTSVATIDSNGILSIKGVGTATITAKRSTDSHSVRELTSTLSLTVTKGDQAALIFNQSELAVGLKKTTASNVATGGSSSGAITYSIDNTKVATVNSTNGELILKSTGTATVTATKAGDANYSTISNSYILTVNNKQDQPPLNFQQASITLDYKQGGVTTSNAIVSGGEGSGEITYRSDNTDIATVDNNGVVTIKSGGTVIIRATKAGDTNYNPTEASYILTVNKIAQSGFSFTQSTVTLTYLKDKITTNIPQGGQSKGVVTYHSNNQDVATVNDKGQVTINGAGTATITATKAEDTNYKAISSSYVLVVHKAQQTGFGFTKAVFSLAYVADGTTSNATVGEQGVGTVTYSIDNTSVATIATDTGIVTLKGIGRAKITANKAEDSNYQAATSSYVLVVTKGKQTGFGFARSTVTLTYLTDTTASNIPQGGQSEGTITYSIDNTSVATIATNTGIVTLKGAGTAIITAIRAEDTTYQAIASSYVLVVHKAQQTGFRFSKDVFTVAYSKDKKISNIIPQGGQGAGAITYNIDNTNVAIIDNNTGELTLKSIGTATVTAMKASDDNYLPTSATYVLNVSRELSITLGSIKNIKFAWNATTGTDYYRLESDLGKGAGFVDASTSGFVVTPNSNNIKQTTAQADIVLHRYVPLVDGPQYQVEACDAGNTCHSTAYGFLTNVQLNELIGYFKASNTGEKDEFGTSVSISDDGNTLAVGAIGEASNSTGVDGVEDNSSATNSGAVYVFTRSSTGAWKQQAYIKASNTDNGDEFGTSVSISGDGNTLAVGALNEDSNSTGVNGAENNSSATNSGAVYVFTRNVSTWSQQAYIKASNTGANDQFGNSVSLSDDGNSLAVGATGEDSNSTGVGGVDNNNANDAGAAYFFTRSITRTWNQQAYIKASNASGGDGFGSSVSISGDGNTLVVGANLERGISTGVGGVQTRGDALAGAVYVFTRSTPTWSQQAYIKPSSISNQTLYQFGWSVSLSDDGNSLAVGATGEDSNSTGVDGAENNINAFFNSGAVYVFTRSGLTWSQQAYIKASNTGGSDQFGYAVSLSDDGNSLAVSAPFEDSNAKGVNGKQNNDDGSANQSGAVYVFTRSASTWSQQAYIKASNSGANDAFGISVSLSADGNSLAVGAREEGSTSTGVVNGVPAQDNSGAPESGAVYLY